DLARRLGTHKLGAAQGAMRVEEGGENHWLLAADTVVAVGRRILPKAETPDEAADCLRLLSGRQHRVYTAVGLLTPKGQRRERLVESRVRFKRLSGREMQGYLASGEWRGKAGGYAIQGLAGAFVVKLVGSHSAVVGLPLYETMSLLDGEGFPVRAGWGAMA
ncbi:Maf family protein, partial [Methylobacterium trifolii]